MLDSEASNIPLIKSLCCFCLNPIKKGERTVSNIETKMRPHIECWLETKEKKLESKIRRKR